MERNEAKTNGEQRNYEELNQPRRNESPENEKSRQSPAIKNNDDAGNNSLSSGSLSVNSGSRVSGSAEDVGIDSPSADKTSPADSQNMGKNRKAGSGASTPRNMTPTPADVAPTQEEEDAPAEMAMAQVDPESLIKHPLKNKWAMW